MPFNSIGLGPESSKHASLEARMRTSSSGSDPANLSARRSASVRRRVESQVRPVTRLAASGVVLALVASLVSLMFMAPPVRAADSETTAANLTPSEAEAAAMAQAHATGKPVVVDAETTPTEQVTAQPAGYFHDDINVEPVRQEVDGTWRDIDTTLSPAPDGTVQPGLVQGDLSISDGGPAGSPIATYSNDGHSYSVDSPFALPKPALEGDSAVFSDVLPDVDLVVHTTFAGFSYNWVVKTPEGADDPQLASLTLPVHTDGLQAQATSGGVAYATADGDKAFWTPTPLMWDSSGATDDQSTSGSSSTTAPTDSPAVADVTSLEAVAAGPGPNKAASVATAATDHRVTLTPSQRLLDDPDTVFPVVIDPSTVPFDSARTAFTAVWDIYPNKSFWNTDHSLGAGYEGYEQNKVVRTYLQFKSGILASKHVLGASVNVNQIHDASCTARATQMYRSNAISASTTWNHQPARQNLQDTNNSTVGCNGGTGMVGWDVTKAADSLATNGDTSVTFLIRAKDETDKIAWKQFDDAGATFHVDYVGRPQVPTSLTLATTNKKYTCGTSSKPVSVGAVNGTTGKTDLTIGASVSSNDKSDKTSVEAVFTRYQGSTTLTGPNPSTAGGARAVTAAWNGAADGSYHFTAKSRVVWTYQGVAGSLDSAASSPCYFNVDTTAPEAPDVTSTVFTQCAVSGDGVESCPAQGDYGVPGDITLSLDTAATGIASYGWSLNGGTDHTIQASAGPTTTISVTPTKLSNTLSVWARDAAGNTGSFDWSFKVVPPKASDAWSFDTDPVGTNSGTSSLGSLDLGATGTSAQARIGAQALKVDGGSMASSADTTVSTTRDFTASMWVHLDADAAATVLAAPSSNGDAFEIGYDPTSHSWVAGQRASGATTVVAPASLPALAHTWTHLAITYAATSRQLILYVNGTQQASSTLPNAAWTNNGWWLGCGDDAGAAARCATAEIDDVELFGATYGPDEIIALASPLDAVTNQAVIAPAATWDMSDAAGSTAAADSRFGANLDFSAGPAPLFQASLDGGNDVREGVLTLDGTQTGTTARPVVDSSGSFTIATEFQAAALDHSMVIAQQDGTNGAAWTLAYRAEDLDGDGTIDAGGQWIFDRHDGDVADAKITEVRSSPVISNDAFVSLVAAYDARTGQMSMLVDGNPFEAEGNPPTDSVPSQPFTTPWPARGIFHIGNGQFDGAAAPFAGNIDYLEMFSGAMTDPNAVVDYRNAKTGEIS